MQNAKRVGILPLVCKWLWISHYNFLIHCSR